MAPHTPDRQDAPGSTISTRVDRDPLAGIGSGRIPGPPGAQRQAAGTGNLVDDLLDLRVVLTVLRRQLLDALLDLLRCSRGLLGRDLAGVDLRAQPRRR
jgi:hypothetical protein